MLDPNKHGIYNKQETKMIKWSIIPDKLKSLRFLIFFLLLVYSGFYILTTTSPVWFVLVTMLAFKLSDELDKW